NADNQFANYWIPQQLRKQADKNHRRGNFAAIGSLVKLLEVRFRGGLNRLGANLALGQIPAAKLLAALLQVANFRAVICRAIERRLVQFFIRNRNAET